MKRITYLTTSARRCIAAVVLLFIALLPVMATSTYYYRADVSVKNGSSGGGLVYINNETTTNPNYALTSFVTGSKQSMGNSASTTIYLYASPNLDWLFDHWEQSSNGNNNNYSAISGATSPTYTPSITFNNEYQSSPDRFYYRAVFRQQTGAVKVAVAETGRGTVSINPEENVVGGSATLTANPDASNGIHFLGWNKSQTNTESFISTLNPYTIDPITDDDKGTYYAHFSEAPENIYCRIRNRATGRFLTLYGNEEALKHERTQNNRTIDDGFIFKSSLKLIYKDDAQGNPMTVFLRSGHPAGVGNTNGVNLVASGIGYNDIVTEHDNTNHYPLTMETTANGAVRIYTTYTPTYYQLDPITTYLTDEGGDWAVMQSIVDNKNIYWDVYLLEESNTVGSFGAYAKSGFGGNGEYGIEGNYYTTMYTYFPYQLKDGVKAYYLPLAESSYNEEKKEVHFTEVTDGIVPMNSAVVLECPAVYNDINNRLIPLMPNDNPSITFQDINLLNGYISLYDKEKGANNNPNKVTNDKKTMFILSKIGQDLGWFYFTNDYMTPNKAYLDLSPWEEVYHEHQNDAREIKFVFGFDDDNNGEATGVIAPKYAEEVDGPLFDLNGRRITNGDAYGLKKGLYISNGKKIVVK